MPIIVSTAWPVDTFDSGLDRLPLITSLGVVVPKARLNALTDAAEAAGVQIDIDEAPDPPPEKT